MVEKPVYIITFDSANDSSRLYKILKEQFLNIYMIQTPCYLTAGCARSLEVKEHEIDKAISIIKALNLNVRAIHKKYVNEAIRRYAYEEISF